VTFALARFNTRRHQPAPSRTGSRLAEAFEQTVVLLFTLMIDGACVLRGARTIRTRSTCTTSTYPAGVHQALLTMSQILRSACLLIDVASTAVP
jgi:hypothetical protein